YLDALPERQNTGVRLFWRWFRGRRVQRFQGALEKLHKALGPFVTGETPTLSTPEDEPEPWQQYLLAQSRALARAERLVNYGASLDSLREVDFSEVAQRRNQLQSQLVETSSALWQRWVAAQPALLKSDQRLMLSRY